MKITTFTTLTFVALDLASCMSNAGNSVYVAKGSIEGAWYDQNGLVSKFANGRVVTSTTDGTDTQLATGMYTPSSNGGIRINLYSNVKQTSSVVDCTVDAMAMKCTTGSREQFTLTRKI